MVITNTTYKEYYGASEGEFKSRYNNHTQSFRNMSHINDTELSKYLWTLKANGTDYHLKWSIKSYASRLDWTVDRTWALTKKNDKIKTIKSVRQVNFSQKTKNSFQI